VDELFLFMLGIAGLVSVPCCGALLALGKMIDRYPTEYEENRTRSLSSPLESTRIAVGVFWVLFVSGIWALLQQDRLLMIAGVTLIFATCLFLFTALAFSFAVLCALRRRREAILEIEREVAVETARVQLEKTAGVRVPSPFVPKAKPVRRIPSTAIDALLRHS